jgi:hypothetical protein
MFSRKTLWAGLAIGSFFAMPWPASAQISPAEPDPLARMRAAASAQTCSVNEASACAQANPKIVAAALGPSSLADNLRRLDDLVPRATGTPGFDRAAAWAVAAFREAGVDEVSAEDQYGVPLAAGGEAKQKNIVAVIHGREKPEEFVLLGAHLDSSTPGASDNSASAALIVEAARDIHLTGLRPRRSIRFVLFGGEEQGLLGSWAYVRAHRAELDRAIAVVIFAEGAGRVTGFSLGGRLDLEPGVREAFAVAPVDTWNIGHNTYDAPLRADNFDFLLEGVPNLLANREGAGASPTDTAAADARPKLDLDGLKHDAAVAGVLAFALAERSTPLARRLSRAEVEALLSKTGLDAQMKQAGTWGAWEIGQRGRP